MESTETPTPLIIQSDRSILLDVHDPGFHTVRRKLMVFAELERSPEHLHFYRITPISLWNAASAGASVDSILAVLTDHAKYPPPDSVVAYIRNTLLRFGKIIIHTGPDDDSLFVEVRDELIQREILAQKQLASLLTKYQDGFLVKLTNRGRLKCDLIKLGYPIVDEAPLIDGEPLQLELREVTVAGKVFSIRDYQMDAVEGFLGDGRPGTGFGTVVLPCGGGKTVVGLDIMARLKTKTLIVTSSITSSQQWIRELLDKTTLTEDEIGEYSGSSKEIRSVTVATYQILTWRRDKNGSFPHFSLFHREKWGLIIYDEVHLIPAPVFRITSDIQAVRRLGLTATLVREDNREDEVFALVGPKRFDVPWKDLETQNWISKAICQEVRIPLSSGNRLEYMISPPRDRYRIAAENPKKIGVTTRLISQHEGESILVIGQYLRQLNTFAKELKAPLITGKTPHSVRESLFEKFRKGDIVVLVVSKVANMAVDLPDASVAIQVSGTFGSRQEEAQRLGRILRPKKNDSHLYTLVSSETCEEEFSANRQKFLIEQGYIYTISEMEG